MPRPTHSTRMPQPDSVGTDVKNIRGPLQHRCSHCVKPKPKLFVCQGCNAVRYCSRDHQIAHRPQHKQICVMIKKCRAKLAKEEDGVRNATPDFMTPANAFETHVGHFWSTLSTRNYMRARFELADIIRMVGTLDGIQQALAHLRDMLRLCRSDNMGVRDQIPALMLQLDQDQECYDFVKWYETEGQRANYNWGDMDLPFLDVSDANVFESPEFIDKQYGGLHNTSAIMLLKLKLLVDILNIKLTRKVLSGRLPVELRRKVELAVIRSPLSGALERKSYLELVAIQGTLERHVKQLARVLNNTNEHFFYGLLNADEYLSTRPQMYSRGSIEEMQIALNYGISAWWKTEGVLDLLFSAKVCAGKDSFDEIAGMMRSSTFKRNPGSSRSREELLEDVSINRMWGYFDWAVEDAGSLASERPSDQHMKRLRKLAAEEERGFDSEDDDDGDEME